MRILAYFLGVSLSFGEGGAGVSAGEFVERLLPIIQPRLKIGSSGEAIGKPRCVRVCGPVVDGAVLVSFFLVMSATS